MKHGLFFFRDELNNSENQRNPVKYKQLIQQVILYMTKGIDMTPLFMTIVKVGLHNMLPTLCKLKTFQRPFIMFQMGLSNKSSH